MQRAGGEAPVEAPLESRRAPRAVGGGRGGRVRRRALACAAARGGGWGRRPHPHRVSASCTHVVPPEAHVNSL